MILLYFMFSSAWMQFHLRKKRNCEEAERKWVIAGTHYKHRILRMHLYLWIVSFSLA